MPYIFKGSLGGFLCSDCREPLAKMKVRLYRVTDVVQEPKDVTELADANVKRTFAILTDEIVKRKESSLIAEVESDELGNFVFALGEKERYGGEAFELDVYCGTVPFAKKPPKPREPIQFTITTLKPDWKQSERALEAQWSYNIPFSLWCAIRAMFDAWVICGHVVACDTKTPVSGVRVRAFDADWIQDDALGEAITDANGHFRIDYTSSDFKQTFLSPWFNIEVPIPPTNSGPDVYFKVETMGGSVLLTENRADGYGAGRANVSNCFCVDLCIKYDGPGTPVDTIPLFQTVGIYSVDPVDGHFTATGLTTSGHYAFVDSLDLKGIMPDGQNSVPVEYRFRIGEWTGSPLVIGPLNDVTASQINATQIGSLEYFDWDPLMSVWTVRSKPYFVNNPGTAAITIHRPPALGGDLNKTLNVTVKPDGFIEIPRENTLTPGGEGRFIPNAGMLISLNTLTLMNEMPDLQLPAPGLTAGDAVPAGQKSKGRLFQIRFEARNVTTHASLGSNVLDKITICNVHYSYSVHPHWAGGPRTTRGVASLDIVQLGGGCGSVIDTVNAKFTAYHPFASSGSITFEGPTLPSPLVMPSTTLTYTLGESLSAAGGTSFSFAGFPACAYIAWLSVTLDLTSGYGPISDRTMLDHIGFCIR